MRRERARRAPGDGVWHRNLRLGDRSNQPMSVSFETWLLPAIASGVACEVAAATNRPPAALRAFAALAPPSPPEPASRARGLARARNDLAFMAMARRPEWAEGLLAPAFLHRWPDALESYRATVAGAATLGDVDAIAHQAGRFLAAVVLGSGALADEAGPALDAFVRRHVPETLPDGAAALLGGLRVAVPPPPHAVETLDWIHPTRGERGPLDEDRTVQVARYREGWEHRERAELAVRRALADRPRLARRFEALLAVAQRSAGRTDEALPWLTLGWPELRRLMGAAGAELTRAGVIERPDDVYHLRRDEIDAARRGDRTSRQAEARARRRHFGPVPGGVGTPDRVDAPRGRPTVAGT